MPPDELAIPVEVVEARLAESNQWIRNMPAGIKVTQVDKDKPLQPTSAVRLDH